MVNINIYRFFRGMKKKCVMYIWIVFFFSIAMYLFCYSDVGNSNHHHDIPLTQCSIILNNTCDCKKDEINVQETSLLQMEKYLNSIVKEKTFLNMSNMLKLSVDRFIYKVSNSTLNYENYKYLIEVKKTCHQSSCNRKTVFIGILEYHDGKLTNGGSSFKITTTSSLRRTACGYNDLFNGSYTSCCNIGMECTSIKMVLMYIDFDAFRYGHDFHALKKVIYEINIGCIQSVSNLNTITQYNTRLCLSVCKLPLQGQRVWYKCDNIWHLGTSTCIIKRTMEIDQCIRKKKMYLLGDSHMEVIHSYYVNSLSNDGHQMVNFTKEQLRYANYKKIRFASEVQTILHDLMNHIAKELPSSIPATLIDFGHWDLKYGNCFTLLYNLTNMLPLLSNLTKYGPVIYMNIIAFPEHIEPQSRNNFLIGAINKYIQSTIAHLDVSVYDAFHYTFPMTEFNIPCGTHFICSKKDKLIGNTGMYLVEDMLLYICK